ncbi:hypothetical protein L249_8098, partial [Ophiocordyceps polyrhachis-furcata BCC 54312]
TLLHTHTQGTRPEGLEGSRNAGPAVAGPRPLYVIEAEAATATARLRCTAATAVRAVRAVRRKERRLLFSSSGFPSFFSLPLLPTAGPTAYRDDRVRVRIRIRIKIRNEIDSGIREKIPE